MNNQLPLNQKNPGNFSIEGTKLRIQNNMGMSSVLFEDISSITYKSISNPDLGVIFLSTFLGMGITFAGCFNSEFGIGVFGFIIFIGGAIYANKNPKRFDNVIVETRGGMLLFYSVDFGQGINEVNKIEEEKRRMTNSN